MCSRSWIVLFWRIVPAVIEILLGYLSLFVKKKIFFRVNFKGCVEKEELLKIVERLWRQEQRNKEGLDQMQDDSLCKICMDAAVSKFTVSLIVPSRAHPPTS